jgi:hypothetical protein
MSAFDRSLSVFPVSAVLLCGVLVSMVGSGRDSACAQDSPVKGSSFSSATSVHDDKHVRNVVLQHSTSETRPLGEIQRGWTAAHGKPPSRATDVVSLQSADARPGGTTAKNRRPKPAPSSRSHSMLMVSAGRPAIPPVPEPIREDSTLEDLAPVESAPVASKSVADSAVPELPAVEPPAVEAIPSQQPAATTPPLAEKAPVQSPKTADRPVLSATERFKLALEEERRRMLAEQAAADEETPVLPSLDEGPVDLAPVEDLPAEQLPSQYGPEESSELSPEDSEARLPDESARRFSKLKQQLKQLKSHFEQPEATDAEQQPLNADEEHTDPRQNHSTTDQEPRHEGHSEELLPPVDELDSGHAQTNSHAPEPGHDDAPPHDDSASGDASDPVTEHSETPHGHRSSEQESAADTNSDSHAIDPPANADSHHADDSHGKSAAGEHSAAAEAAHAASEHAVVHGTIDRLGLANNLYAVGEYELALDMYENTDITELTAQQQIWTDYQTANCLRRMGRHGDASNRYRRIAEQPEAGWLSEQSRWWVDVLEQIRQLQSSLEENPENPDENLQSPFQGVPRESKSSGETAGPSEPTKSGPMKSRSTKSGHTDHPSSANTKTKSENESSAASSASQKLSRTTKPSKERITHFAPAEKEPKHGEH